MLDTRRYLMHHYFHSQALQLLLFLYLRRHIDMLSDIITRLYY